MAKEDAGESQDKRGTIEKREQGNFKEMSENETEEVLA